jgi:multidrug efflux pump subunit AcrA (membrane-fusion protein)
MFSFNRKAFIFRACLSSSFIFLGVSPWAYSQTLTLNALQQSAMGLETEIAQSVDLIPSAVYPAQAALPLQTLRILSSPLSGQIVKLNYVHGLIEKGQVIAEIESPELLQMQEDLLATLSDLKIYQQNLTRAKKLNQSGVSSTKKLQQAFSEVNKSKLKKNQLEKNLLFIGMAEKSIELLKKTQRLQPLNLQIKSPIDGQLFDLQVRLGERVEKNQTIISMGETNPIILVVRVPVEMANEIEPKQQVKLISKEIMGVVQHIDMMVDTMTQSVDVHIKVQNDKNELRSGQLFKIRFLAEKTAKTYKISANAISQYDGKTVVFNQANSNINVLPIEVVTITDKQLYFIPKSKFSAPLTIYSKGSTAIKAALDASNEPDGE